MEEKWQVAKLTIDKAKKSERISFRLDKKLSFICIGMFFPIMKN